MSSSTQAGWRTGPRRAEGGHVGLDVEHGSALDGVEAPDAELPAVDCQQLAHAHADAVGAVLGPLGQDPHGRPVRPPPGVTGAPGDLVIGHAVEDEHHLEVGELTEPGRGVGTEALSVELDRRLDGSPVVVGRVAASTHDGPDRRHLDLPGFAGHGPDAKGT